MDISNEVTATLRAQDHGHPPIICKVFNESGKGYWMDGVGYLRANETNGMGARAVCIALEGNGSRPSHRGSGYSEDGRMFTLNTIEKHAVCFQLCGDRDNPSVSTSEKAYCLPANPMSDRQQAVLYGVDFRNMALDKEKTHTIQAKPNGGFSYNCTPGICYTVQGNMVDLETRQGGTGISKDVSPTLNTRDKHAVCYGISRSMLTGGMNAGGIPVGEEIQPAMTANGAAAVCYQIGVPRNAFCETEISRTLDTGCVNPACNEGGMAIVYPAITGALCANSHPGSYTGQDAFNDMLPVIRRNEMEGRKYVLRRLTPLECCRLQGFPDWWVDGVEGSDSAIYKMWGNGIALPCAADVIGRIAKAVESEETK